MTILRVIKIIFSSFILMLVLYFPIVVLEVIFKSPKEMEPLGTAIAFVLAIVITRKLVKAGKI